MEPRTYTSHKENVAPRLATPLKSAPQRFLKNPAVSLGSGHWWISTEAALQNDSNPVQTNLSGSCHHLRLTPKDWTGQLNNSSFLQQSNLGSPVKRPLGRAGESAVQQSNLGMRETSCAARTPHLRPQTMPQGHPLPRGSPVSSISTLRPPLAAHFREGLSEHTWSDSRPFYELDSWTSRLEGEHLTLEDLAAPVQGWSWAATRQCVASVEHLEHKVAHLGYMGQVSQELPGIPSQNPKTRDSQSCQPLLAVGTERKNHLSRIRVTQGSPKTNRAQTELSDLEASSELTDLPMSLQIQSGGILDPHCGVLPIHPVRQGKSNSPEHPCGGKKEGNPKYPLGMGIGRGSLYSSTSAAHQGMLAGQEEDMPREMFTSDEANPAASSVLDSAPARDFLKDKAQNIAILESGQARQPLPRCFRGYQQLAQRQQAAAAAQALCRRRRLRQGLRALRWALWLREAQLKEVWARHLWGLLVQNFRKWRTVTLQKKQGQTHFQAKPGASQPGAGQGQDHPGSKPEVDPCSSSSRYFRAWQWFLQRQASYRDCLARYRAGTLRRHLHRWVHMKQLRMLHEAKVTQLSLLLKKTGNMALCSSVAGGTAAHGQEMVIQAQTPSQQSLQQACRRLALCRVLLLWRVRLSQHQQSISFLQVLQQRILRCTLRGWHLRAWGPHTMPGSTTTTITLEPLGSVSEGAVSLGCSLEQAPRGPAHPETLLRSFLGSTKRKQERRCFLLWQTRLQQLKGAMSWHQRAQQRRVLLGWNRWATAQGARSELAAHWAWCQSCRAVLGLWRQRLSQWQQAEHWTQKQAWRRAGGALRHWHSCWQRQQCLQDRYQRWVQAHNQGLQGTSFQSWLQAAAQQRCRIAVLEQFQLQSLFQASRGVVRGRRVLQAKPLASQSGMRRSTLAAILTVWQETQDSAAHTQQSVAQTCLSHCRGLVQKSQAQQAFRAWQIAVGWSQKTHQQAEEQIQAQAWLALCWTLWLFESRLHQLSRALAASKLCTRVLEAWAHMAAQHRVMRAAATQLQQAGPHRLLQTHWAQWQAAALRVWLESWARAQEASSTHSRPRVDLRCWPTQASREHLLALMDTPASQKQTHGCNLQVPGCRLPGPAQHHTLDGQMEFRKTNWAQSDRGSPFCCAFPPWLLWPAQGNGGLPYTDPGGDTDSEANAPGSKDNDKKMQLGTCLQQWRLEALFRRLQASQRTRRLTETWQCWVDAQGAEQLARTLFRQWHLQGAWRIWRRRVLQLQVAQRLQQKEDRCILSQAFERWFRSLAARDVRGRTSITQNFHFPQGS